MEQLTVDIEAYAAARGIKPATVLQISAGLSGTTWEKWVNGTSSCSFRTADRIRAFMREHSPVAPAEGANAPQTKDAA